MWYAAPGSEVRLILYGRYLINTLVRLHTVIAHLRESLSCRNAPLFGEMVLIKISHHHHQDKIGSSSYCAGRIFRVFSAWKLPLFPSTMSSRLYDGLLPGGIKETQNTRIFFHCLGWEKIGRFARAVQHLPVVFTEIIFVLFIVFSFLLFEDKTI